MKNYIILIFICLFLSGCAKYYDSLVNPKTKDGVNCVAEGWGWLGTPLAARNSNLYIERYSAAGYTPIEKYISQDGKLEELKTASIVFTSDIKGASIYVGPANRNEKSWVRLNGKTPWTILLNNKRIIPECYKATYDGKDSNIICFEQEDHTRKVHFMFQ